MSSAPASALTSIIAAPALPAESAVSATPLDPTQTSAFSRMLDAEASLVQAVTSNQTQSGDVAAELPAVATQIAVDNGAGVASDVAMALAQAAQAGLSALPVATESPVSMEVPNSDLENEVASETDSSNPEVLGESATHDAIPQVFSHTTAPTFQTHAESKPETNSNSTGANNGAADVITTHSDGSSESTLNEKQAALASSQGRTSFISMFRSTIEPSQNAEVIVADVQPEVASASAKSPSSAATVSTLPFELADESELVAAQPAAIVQNCIAQFVATKDSESNGQSALPGIEQTTNTKMHVTAQSELKVDVPQPDEAIEDATDEITPEILLGAAGVLTATTPRAVQGTVVQAKFSDESQQDSEIKLDTDFGAAPDAGARAMRSTPSSGNDAAPVRDFNVNIDTVAARELTSDVEDDSTEDVAGQPIKDFAADVDVAPLRDFKADVEATPVDLAVVKQRLSSDVQTEAVSAAVTTPGEMRVIASQSSRKEVASVVAEKGVKSDLEIQPLRTELRAVASDKKSGERVLDRAISADFARYFAGGEEKIARQSSPEGISYDAGQREISASAMTAPFVDGGRPETIASRNSSEPAATANPTRAERLLDHTLDAIPNPLRVTTFEIKPEGHGVIRVRISARGEGENAVWRVQINTSDPSARSLLSEHMNELRERLPAENVQVELGGANDVRQEVPQRETGGSRERNGEQRQSREEQQRQSKQQKSGNFLEWLAAQE